MMWYRLEQAANGLLRTVNQLDTNQWLVVSALAVVVGALFLRGYGSRTSY